MKRTILLVGSIVLILLGGGSMWSQYSQAQKGLEPLPPPAGSAEGPREGRRDQGRMSPFGAGGPDGGGRMFSQEEREKMAKDLGLTDEQQKQIDEIFKKAREADNPMDRFKAFGEARKVLTPEQQKLAEKTMRSRGEERMQRRLEEAKKRLSPREYEQMKSRMEEMRKRMESGQSPFPGGGWPGRGGRGGGGNGGPPPPPEGGGSDGPPPPPPAEGDSK